MDENKKKKKQTHLKKAQHFTENQKTVAARNTKEEQHTEEKWHKNKVNLTSLVFHNEDIAQKKASIFFGKELLAFYGIPGRMVYAAPTELADIKVSNLYQDYNYVMEDGTWRHMEFTSEDIDEKDLKRFRAYEALASYQYNVDIMTYVVCSAKVKNPKSRIQAGFNTYQVIPICLGDRDAEVLLKTLMTKRSRREPLTREDFIQLALCPIMGGSISQYKRIKAALKIIQDSTALSYEEKETLVSVLYVLADKFLNSKEMEIIKGVMKMTKLGQMIFEDGVSQGHTEGYYATITGILRKKMQEGVSPDAVAKYLNLDKEYTQRLCSLLQDLPAQDDLEIARTFVKEMEHRQQV